MPQRAQLSPIRPSAQAVIEAVAEVHGIEPDVALRRRSGAVFKEVVYLLRGRANLSLREVAAMAGVSIGRVAQIQSEIESAPLEVMLRRVVSKL